MNSHRKTAVVIPSIRQIVPERIASIPDDVDIFVVNDSEEVIEPCRARMMVFSLEQQREIMGPDFDLIPRGTGACRNFGFYYVWKHTDREVVITIDDDVVCPDDFLSQYDALGSIRGWPNISVDSGWFNTIEFAGVQARGGGVLYPRGFPFWLRAPHPYSEDHRTATGRLVCLMGLWSNCLDYDGIDKFLFDDYGTNGAGVSVDAIVTIGHSRRRTMFPLNCGVVRELLPAAYQFPMDRRITLQYPIWRFDDIWSGYVLQSLLHRRANGDRAGVGPPIVAHLKDGDLKREILGEHFGHLMSPFFYALIDRGVAEVEPGPYADMTRELFTRLCREAEKLFDELRCPPLYRTYFADTFARLARWAELCAAG